MSNIVCFTHDGHDVVMPERPFTQACEKSLRHYLPGFFRNCPPEILSAMHNMTECNFNHLSKKYYMNSYSDAPCNVLNCYSCRLKISLHRNFNIL